MKKYDSHIINLKNFSVIEQFEDVKAELAFYDDDRFLLFLLEAVRPIIKFVKRNGQRFGIERQHTDYNGLHDESSCQVSSHVDASTIAHATLSTQTSSDELPYSQEVVLEKGVFTNEDTRKVRGPLVDKNVAPLYCINSNEIRYQNEVQEFPCQHCDMIFISADFLDIHLSEHIRNGDPMRSIPQAEPLFRCLPCSLAFNSFENFRKHSEEVHPFNHFPPKKRRRVSSSSDVDILDDTGDSRSNFGLPKWSVYKCSTCKVELNSWKSYFEHVLSGCTDTRRKVKTICGLCSHNTNQDKAMLLKHMFECHALLECLKCKEEVHGREIHGHLLNHGLPNISNFLTSSSLPVLQDVLGVYLKHCQLHPSWICVTGTLSNERANTLLASIYNGEFSSYIVVVNGTWVCQCFCCQETFCQAYTAVRHHYITHSNFDVDTGAKKYIEYLQKLNEDVLNCFKPRKKETEDKPGPKIRNNSKSVEVRKALLELFEYNEEFKDFASIKDGTWLCQCCYCDSSYRNPESALKHLKEKHRVGQYDKYAVYLRQFIYKYRRYQRPTNSEPEILESSFSMQDIYKESKKFSNLINTTESSVTFKCFFCSKSFDNALSVRMHQIKKHKFQLEDPYFLAYQNFIIKYQQFTSRETNKKLTQKSELWKEFQGLISISQKRWRGECLYCNNWFLQPTALINHLQSRHPNKGVRTRRYIDVLKKISEDFFLENKIIPCEVDKSLSDKSLSNTDFGDSIAMETEKNIEAEDHPSLKKTNSPLSADRKPKFVPVIRINREKPKVCIKRKLSIGKGPGKHSKKRPELTSQDVNPSQSSGYKYQVPHPQPTVPDIQNKSFYKGLQEKYYPVIQKRLDQQAEVEPESVLPKKWKSKMVVECWYCSYPCKSPHNLICHLYRNHRFVKTDFIKKYRNAIRLISRG